MNQPELTNFSPTCEINHECVVNQSIESIRMQFDKYKNDVYMTSRLYKMLCTQFPAMLENIDKIQIARNERVNALVVERDAFICTFLENCKYFFCEKTERFFYYDGDKYILYNEDDILYHILSGISNGPSILMNWKRRTKKNVMQRIKSNNILTSIPESNTIQRVMAILTPMMFSSRAETKYFLTVIGDSIHRKTVSEVHLIPLHAKPFVTSLNQICISVFGTNIMLSFKYKYHDHDYAQCRIININDSVSGPGLWGNTLTENALDILCVAAHYSSRYDNAETYMSEYSSLEDDCLQHTVCFLKNKTKEDVVSLFINTYVEKSGDSQVSGIYTSGHSTGISWKNMHYLWKHFLQLRGLPCIIFQNELKEILLSAAMLQSAYLPETDEFSGVFSKYLPGVDAFLKFWDESITPDDTEKELEVEEIAILLKRWCVTKFNTNIQYVNTKTVPDILGHYFPNVEVRDGKYIDGFRCILWDKKEDIRASVISTITNDLSSSSAYMHYCTYCKNNSANKGLVVSKAYFEQYMFENGYTAFNVNESTINL